MINTCDHPIGDQLEVSRPPACEFRVRRGLRRRLIEGVGDAPAQPGAGRPEATAERQQPAPAETGDPSQSWVPPAFGHDPSTGFGRQGKAVGDGRSPGGATNLDLLRRRPESLLDEGCLRPGGLLP